jgi:hypothetical protein
MTSQDISFVLMLISSVSLLVIVGLIIFIGIVVVRLLGLFSEVNSVSQAMRLEVNKLLHKTASLSNAER